MTVLIPPYHTSFSTKSSSANLLCAIVLGIGIAIFGYLYWSGERDYKKKEKDNKQNQ